MGVKRLSTASLQCSRVIPEIDIWRAATLMLKRYGDKALEQSRTRIDELALQIAALAMMVGKPDGSPALVARVDFSEADDGGLTSTVL